MRIPLKMDTNVEKINLDLSTPRIKQAMQNLGIDKSDLVHMKKEESGGSDAAVS